MASFCDARAPTTSSPISIPPAHVTRMRSKLLSKKNLPPAAMKNTSTNQPSQPNLPSGLVANRLYSSAVA
eukprot:2266473-Amphidinium_carterae.1